MLDPDFSSDMLAISEGPFTMGVNEEQSITSAVNERPSREIRLPAFGIAKSPVTVSSWLAFIDKSGYEWPRREWSAACEKELGMQPEGTYPITFVSWNDAKEFTDWLSRMSGMAYSLPTDAQWERACRGTSGRLYPWSSEVPDLGKELDLLGPGIALHPVGSYADRRSPAGCLDMWCSVSEWCEDAYDDEFQPNGRNLMLAPGPNLALRVVRGGNWWDKGWPL